ncbi:snoRNP complex protein nop56 [Orobanche hederae]
MEDGMQRRLPRRPSRHNSHSEPIIRVSHDRFLGVYVSKHDANTLYTKNLVPGQAPLSDDDVVISVKDNDGSVMEYREWDPYRSKFAAAILPGDQNIWIKPGRYESLAAYLNALYFLKTGGHYLLFVQLIVLNQEAGVMLCSVLCSNQKSLSLSECSTSLEPFDRDHAYVFGAFRMIEMVDPSCLVTNKFWTDPSSHRGDGERVTIYEQLKDLPVFMLFETSCGYALFQAHGMFKVERNYVAIEKYISRCDEVFELIAYQPFESADDALVHLNAVCNGMFLT